MKTKTMLAIVVVLCSLLLVVLPATAIAAAEDDFVLGVYGNANEDDTIDMRDLTYVKLIFFGERQETELADAKYDGEINPLDFVQIKLIIVGKEKELTVMDSADRIVTVKKPIERVVLGTPYQGEAVRVLRAQDKVVAISGLIKQNEAYFPELSKLPDIGYAWQTINYEVILSQNPDLVIAGIVRRAAELAEKLPGIAVVAFNCWSSDGLTESLVKLGYILGKKDEAECYIDDFHGKYIGLIKARTEGLSEEEKPKVYVGSWSGKRDFYLGACAKSGDQQMLDLAGGKNIFADLDVDKADIDPEEILSRNPDIIIRFIQQLRVGHGYDDPSEIKALWVDTINRPELANVNAVKNRRVYIIDHGLSHGSDYPIAVMYLAKWFHPDLFEDLDPKAIHQEYLTEFQGLGFDVKEHGIFVYHPELYPNGR